MNHEEAQASQAVERYTLDEMQIEERDAFEEHYFDCRVCSEGVRDGAKMMAAGRRVARETSNVVPFVPRWKAWIPAAAAALLLMVNGILLTVAPRVAPGMQLAELSNTVIAVSSQRSQQDQETPSIEITAARPTMVTVDGDPKLRSYEVRIHDSAGKQVDGGVAVKNDQAKQRVYLLLPSLPAGSYVLTIDGVQEGNGTTHVVKKQKLTVR